MKRAFKIIGLTVAVLLLLGLAAVVWFATRPPKPAKMIDPSPIGQRIDKDGLLANYFPAAGPGRKPAILLLGGSEGGLALDLYRQAALLQREGYNVLHIAYHNAPGKPATLTSVPLEDFQRGFDWLKARPDTDPAAIGIVGYSKGAEAALLVASRNPGIKAVVLGMPSSVAWDGLDAPSIFLGLHSSWSEGGKRVASLGYGSFDPDKGLFEVFDSALNGLADHPEAVIPVERVKAPVLMICGAKDSLWPACRMADQIKARAAQASGPPVTLLRYAEAGHGAMGAPIAATDRDMVKFAKLGGTADANAAARTDSWAKLSAFLRETLPRPLPADSAP